MEKIRGTLVVEEINGRRGPFCVGMLLTSIGEFKVTDKEIDQYAPGRYVGEFLIEELRTKTVPWRRGTFTYIQALIAEGGFLIDEAQHAHPQDTTAQPEPDPLDEPDLPSGDQALPARPSPEPAPALAQGKTRVSSAGAEHDDEKLFGVELYPQFAQRGSPIALDPTVDRAQFRAQRERLKAAGYSFNATSQHWVLGD